MRDRRTLHPLSRALALAWLAGLTGMACGARVVIDPSPAPGTGGTGGAVATGSASGIGTGGAAGSTSVDAGSDADGGCMVDASPADTTVQGCFQSTYCPMPETESAREQLTTALAVCDTTKLPCCNKNVIDRVGCGPSASEGNCCYMVFVKKMDCTDGG